MQLDEEITAELLDSCNELCGEIEIDLDKLSRNQEGDLNALFRNVHTIKGNAAIMQLSEIVAFTHSLEEVFGALRDQKFSMTKSLCEALQLGIDRIRDLHHRDLLNEKFDCLNEEELQTLYKAAANAAQEDIDAHCKKIVSVYSGSDISEDTQTIAANDDLAMACLTRSEHPTKASFDLRFFRELAAQVDKQSRYWVGRSDQLNDWALKVNAMRGDLVDPEQLSAAVYLHDIGMCYVNNTILDKESPLAEDELAELRMHPSWGYNYLLRVQGWDPAATMILEHHERIDGTGYPNGNKGELIHEGSKLLAIIDAFFSLTNGRADRAQRRCTIKAISEINSCVGTQFDQDWVLAFNDLIKKEVRSGSL